MLTRRTLLRGLPLLLALPRGTEAQPRWWQPTAHWLNHPRVCRAWYLATERHSGPATWVDMLERRVGTLVNMQRPPSVLSGLQRLTTRRSGWGAVRFDAGTSTRMTVSGRFTDPPQLTMSCWARFPTAPLSTTQYTAISLGDSVGLILHGGTTNGSRPRGFFYDGSTWPVTQPTASGGYQGPAWHHWAYTWQPALQRLYLDGRVLATTTTAGSITYTLGTGTVIGGHGNGGTTGFYTGDLDDVRIYNRALTPQAIHLLYIDSLTGYRQLLTQDQPWAYAPQAPTLPLVHGPALLFGN